MTQVTVLERSVLRNIAESNHAVPLNVTMTYVMTRNLVDGPETVNLDQLQEVIMSLVEKSLISQPTSSSVRLTDDGLDVYKREFQVSTPSAVEGDVLEALRLESNVELNRVHPMSAHTVKLTNDLITLRADALKLLSFLDTFKRS
jgi:hypothetical protein